MRRLLTALFIATLGLLPAFCRAEENLTITTYYPSPQGIYGDLRLYPTGQPTCDASHEGVMYYNGTEVNAPRRAWLCYYNGTDYNWSMDFSGGAAGYWADNATQNSIHNVNNGNVSIGTSDAQAALTVSRSDPAAGAEDPLVAAVDKHFVNSGADQWLSFALFPPNTTYAPYLNRTSMIHTSIISPLNRAVLGNLFLAAVNATGSISFNVGNYSDPQAEVMRMTDPCYDDTTALGACPRVGIGNTTPIFPLQVESDASTGPVALRAVRNGAASGIFNIAPWQNRTDLAFGCYLKNGQWYNDPYEYPPAGSGSYNNRGVRFTLEQTRGALWSSYNNTNGNSVISSWNIANDRQLWNLDGTWVSNVTLKNAPVAAGTCSAANNGQIVYNATTGNFYGCRNNAGWQWQQFNN